MRLAQQGRLRGTDAERADRETLIRDLVEGQYSHPVRIVAFNTTEGWSRDVTVEHRGRIGGSNEHTKSIDLAP